MPSMLFEEKGKIPSFYDAISPFTEAAGKLLGKRRFVYNLINGVNDNR